jgi:hypothetical protein
VNARGLVVTHGDNATCPEVQSGKWARCMGHGHDSVSGVAVPRQATTIWVVTEETDGGINFVRAFRSQNEAEMFAQTASAELSNDQESTVWCIDAVELE